MRVATAVALACVLGCVSAASLPPRERRLETLAPTVAPSAAPSAAPSTAPASFDENPFDSGPANQQCVQGVKPPGVKPGSCAQVMCIPDSVQKGETYHTTVRMCLQRPRRWHLTYAMLDEVTKEFFGGAGYGVVDETWQCAEHTFEHEFDAEPTPSTGEYDIMFKYYVVANWGTSEENDVEDQFPNMLAEAGIFQQPDYSKPLSGDCPVLPTRTWNFPPTGQQNAIDFFEPPPCFTPGEEWSVDIWTHLETRPVADLHVNLQIGTGGDTFLGDDDKYLTESNVYGLRRNPVATDWANLPEGYNEQSTITFTAEQTALVEPGSAVYLAAFLVPANAGYNENLPGGWDFLEREFYLAMNYC